MLMKEKIDGKNEYLIIRKIKNILKFHIPQSPNIKTILYIILKN